MSSAYLQPSLPTSGEIMFVAGGSGGHVQTALGVIDTFSEELRQKTLFVGSTLAMEGETNQTSIEQRLCAEAAVPFVAIKSGKLQRSFSFQSIRLLGGILGGFSDSWKLLGTIKPKMIISFGGYVSVPLVLAAWLKKIPVMLHEQTTSIGLANNIAAKVARKIFISYKESARYFPKEKVVFTGSPKRKYLFNPEAIEKKLDPEVKQRISRIKILSADYPLLLIIGGSQGSHTINQVVEPILSTLLSKYQVVLQTGNNQVYKDYERLQAEVATFPSHIQKRVWVTPFLKEELSLLYRQAQVAVSRGGANFVYELGLFGVPSIIIPIPWVTHNEQYTNAQILEKSGLAMILEEKNLTSESLQEAIQRMLKHEKSKETNSELFPADAAEKIRDEITSSL